MFYHSYTTLTTSGLTSGGTAARSQRFGTITEIAGCILLGAYIIYRSTLALNPRLHEHV
jgi:hypothetical protein